MKLARQSRRKYRGYPVQLKYAVILTLIGGFTMLLMIFVMAWFIQRNYNLFMGDELGVSAQVIKIMQHEEALLEVSLFVLFVGSITVMFAAALYVTRKLTGPMVAVQRELWLFSQGDWSKEFRLRKNDEFKEVETVINRIRQNQLNPSVSHSQTSG